MAMLQSINYQDFFPPSVDLSDEIKAQVVAKVAAFLVLSDEFPVCIVHELISGKNTVVFMSPVGLEFLGLTLEELRDMGEAYYKLFFSPEEIDTYLTKWNAFVKDTSNKGVWYTFFHQVKSATSEKPIWFLSVSSIIAYNEHNQPLYSISLSLNINQSVPIVGALDSILGDEKFMKEQEHLFNSLTNKEKEIISKMASGLSPREISRNLFLAETTVRTHRRNIKRKLSIKNDAELIRFARAFNIN